MSDEFPPITDVIPHRSPMLFLTRITALDPGVSAFAEWEIKGDEWFLQGHFPGRPIVPGLIIAESLAQLTAYVALTQPHMSGKLPLLQKVEYESLLPVIPGDILGMTSIITSSGKTLAAHCNVFVEGHLMGTVSVTARGASHKIINRLIERRFELAVIGDD